MQEEKLMKSGEAAKFLNMSHRTFKRRVQEGVIIPTKTTESGYNLFDKEQLEKFKNRDIQTGPTEIQTGPTEIQTGSTEIQTGSTEIQTGPKSTKNGENAQPFIISQVVNTPSVKLSENLPVHRDNPTDKNGGNSTDFSLKNLPTPQPQYSKILQGRITNDIVKQSKKTLHYNSINDTADIITRNGVKITIKSFQSLKLNVNTYKFFDACVIKLTKNFPHGDNVSIEALDKHRTLIFTVDEYMEMCQIKDRKQAFEQLRDAVRTLYNLTIDGTEVAYIVPKGKKKKPERKEYRYEGRLLEFIGETTYIDRPIVDGYVELHFSMDMAKYFSRAYLMPYPNGLLIINGKHNPHSYFIGRKLAEHHNMNIGKSNSNRIAVKSIIDALPDLPKYREVKKREQSTTHKIIIPFERDLIALKDSYGMLADWNYCQSNGKPLTDEQLESYSYNEWSDWLIDFSLANYPDQSERIKKISDFRKSKSQKRKKIPLKWDNSD